MEKEKIVEIQDLDNKIKFKIKLFSPLKGIKFFDTFIATIGDKFSIEPLLKDLLPLATQLTEDGRPVNTLSIETADVLFQNPLAILDLGIEIFNFQQVFFESSPRFRPFASKLQNMLTAMNLE